MVSPQVLASAGVDSTRARFKLAGIGESSRGQPFGTAARHRDACIALLGVLLWEWCAVSRSLLSVVAATRRSFVRGRAVGCARASPPRRPPCLTTRRRHRCAAAAAAAAVSVLCTTATCHAASIGLPPFRSASWDHFEVSVGAAPAVSYESCPLRVRIPTLPASPSDSNPPMTNLSQSATASVHFFGSRSPRRLIHSIFGISQLPPPFRFSPLVYPPSASAHFSMLTDL